MPDEYISREAAMKAVASQYGACRSPAQNRMLDEIRNKIRRMPAADVAPVVRCKDCKYGSYASKPNGAMVCLRTNDGVWRKEADFCSYGEYQTNTGGVTE